MVAGNEVFFTVELFNELFDLMATGEPAEISEAEDEVVWLHLIVPVFDKPLSHLLFVGEWPAAKTNNISVTKVHVRGEVNVLVRGEYNINLLHRM